MVAQLLIGAVAQCQINAILEVGTVTMTRIAMAS